MSARAMTADRRARVLVTPEGVPLPFTLASRGARAGALILDLAMIYGGILAVTLVLVWLGIGIGLDKVDEAGAGGAIQALIVVWLITMFLLRNAWFLFFELGPRGATPGKRITGVRVCARDGGRLTTEAVIARNIVRDIELFMPIVFIGSALSNGSDAEPAAWAGLAWFAVFVLFPFFNRDRLRCGDIVAGTWVVETPRHRLGKALSVAEEPSAGAYRFGDAELSVYGEYELQVLERVLREGRPEAQAEVAATICRKIGWDEGRGDERAFLEAYYTQLRARLETGMRMGRRKADKNA